MKKVIAICCILFLAACQVPIPSEQWTIRNYDLSTVKGFEDCTMTIIKMYENSHSIKLVRCPNSTISINQSVQQGKISKPTTNIVIDGN